MGAIAVFSSSLFGAERTGAWLESVFAALWPQASLAVIDPVHGLLRKVGHVVEYAILAALWLHTLAPGRSPGRAATGALAVSIAYAGLDEALWQGLAPNRSPSPWDVALDAAGAVLGAATSPLAPPALGRGVVRAGYLGATGLAGLSLAALGVDLALGLPAADLALATLGLTVAAVALRSAARAWSKPR
jgi:hypothetical protein